MSSVPVGAREPGSGGRPSARLRGDPPSGFLAPEGRPIVAQGFSPGNTVMDTENALRAPEGRQKRCLHRDFCRPSGARKDSISFTSSNPGLKPWATIGRPSGAAKRLSGSPLRYPGFRNGLSESVPEGFVDVGTVPLPESVPEGFVDVRNGDWLRESSSGACPPSDARSALETGTGTSAALRSQSPFPGLRSTYGTNSQIAWNWETPSISSRGRAESDASSAGTESRTRR